jgi:cytochrome c-type biogenesis protein CcmE
MSKGLQIAAGALAIALLLGWYAYTNRDEIGTFRYYQTLDEFLATPADGSPARVHGYVALGSIERDVEGRQVRFAVVGKPPHAGGDLGPRLSVVYASLETPDLFKDGAEVVVEGRLPPGSARIFEADNVLAKCPSKFQAKETRTASF